VLTGGPEGLRNLLCPCSFTSNGGVSVNVNALVNDWVGTNALLLSRLRTSCLAPGGLYSTSSATRVRRRE
jgi:hypothetical protein